MNTTIKCKKGELIITDDYVTFEDTKIDINKIYFFAILGAFSRNIIICYEDKELKIGVKSEGEKQFVEIAGEIEEIVYNNLTKYFSEQHNPEDLIDFMKSNKLCGFDIIKKTVVPCLEYASELIDKDEKIIIQWVGETIPVFLAGNLFSKHPGKLPITGPITITNKRLISCYKGTHLGKTNKYYYTMDFDGAQLHVPSSSQYLLSNPNNDTSLLIELAVIFNSGPVSRCIRNMIKQ